MRPAARCCITDWRDRNKTFFSALQVERNVMFMILTLIVLVAALNIMSGLIMLVKDKGSDIAILRTMGASSGSIMRIFFMTGAAIGIVGTFAGVALGVVVCLNIESIRSFFSWISGTTIFNPELYFLSQLPADMNLGETVSVVVMAIGSVVPRHDLPGLAGFAPRSGPGPAVRITRITRTMTRARGIAAFRRRTPLRPGRDLSVDPQGRGLSSCAPAKPWRWSRPREPASRRFCTLPVCWNVLMPAK